MATVPVVIDGRSKHRLYSAWIAMLSRCEKPNDKQYKNYGGRGITVCPEWHDFWTYARWIEANIGPRPDDWQITLDRINNDHGYEPGNVRWADRRTQRLNGQDHRVPLSVLQARAAARLDRLG